MSHFLIYIRNDPNEVHITSEDLAAVGLSDLADGCMTNPLPEGPDGKQGTIYAWPSETDRRMHFAPDEQEWFPCKPQDELPAERYWVGLWNDSPPTPRNLQRHYPYAGVNVMLGDGNSWHIPKIRELPQDAILADDGTWKFIVQRKYHSIYLESLEWQEVVRENLEFEWGILVDYLIRCLRLNYRLVPDLASHLRLINTGVLMQALGATLGCELEAVS